MAEGLENRGTLAFLPWIDLPKEVEVGSFKFLPVSLCNVVDRLSEGVSSIATQILGAHVDEHGHPINACCFITTKDSNGAWQIPTDRYEEVILATQLLGLAIMAEQEFYATQRDYINASAFRPIFQSVVLNSDDTALVVRRRDKKFWQAGYKISDYKFQRPIQLIDTKCLEPQVEFLAALDRAQSQSSEVFCRIKDSLPFFMLGHSDEPELSTKHCVMLSAIAFDRLLKPKESRALDLSKNFADLWKNHKKKTLEAAVRRKQVDPCRGQQFNWPLHQKWMKELYELRSSVAHHGDRDNLSSNWEPEQHLVIAAFVYPLAVKKLLANENLYNLTKRDNSHCNALDHLLDCDFQNCRSEDGWCRTLQRWRSSVRETLSREWDKYDAHDNPVTPPPCSLRSPPSPRG